MTAKTLTTGQLVARVGLIGLSDHAVKVAAKDGDWTKTEGTDTWTLNPIPEADTAVKQTEQNNETPPALAAAA